MNFIRAIFKWIDRITAWIAVLSLVLMFFFVFLNVVTRYILGNRICLVRGRRTLCYDGGDYFGRS